jgi:hypothetical protein
MYQTKKLKGFRSGAFQNIQKLVFRVLKCTIWQPCFREEPEIVRLLSVEKSIFDIPTFAGIHVKLIA